ncbi:MAG: CxxC-x17-CxxC domain-containing protein [Patescibacteria group bacterium]|jgi:CxxC-x17-CxxC domain-containing protein
MDMDKFNNEKSAKDSDITLFGITTFRNKNQTFGIKLDDRRRHMYVIGKTGMGKSTLLENMIIGDILAGRGVAVVDPHGDLAEKVIDFVPAERINDVIYFNPADMEFPIAFNVLERVEPHLRHLVASGLIGVFQKLWADSWGPRLEYILRNTILAVLDYPGSTLLAVTRMLSDKDFRKKVIDKIQDPVVKTFWVKEFAGYADKFASEAVSPIQNKVGQFLSSSLIRNIIGQVKSSIDVRKVMDEGKILILNLSKGRIGEDNSALLGSMMITKIQLAAMSRVDVPEADRKDFYLYVDEFQNFATDSFANILSEARKYHLNLIMGHQYIEQLGDMVKAAVFGNVGTLAVFRVGATDAEELVKEFTPTFTEEDLVNLPKYEMYLKLMIDGVSSDPFSARGLPPLKEILRTQSTGKVIKVSRERYSKKKNEVEEKIFRWHAFDEKKEEGPAPRSSSKPKGFSSARGQKNSAGSNSPRNGRDEKKAKTPIREARESNGIRAKEIALLPKKDEQNSRQESSAGFREDNKEIYKYNAACSRCGKDTKISFPPDGIRPVFCKECLTVIKKEKNEEVEERRKKKLLELARLEEVSGTEAPAPKEKPPVSGLRFAGTEGESWKEITLSDLKNIAPIKFGHLKKAEPEAAASSKPREGNNPKEEKKIKAGETIKFD